MYYEKPLNAKYKKKSRERKTMEHSWDATEVIPPWFGKK